MPDIWGDLLEVADDTTLDVMGETVTYNGTDLVAIFENRYQLEDAGQAGFAGARPMIFTRLESLPAGAPEIGDTVEFKGKTYGVIEPIERDGQGGVVLWLIAQQPPAFYGQAGCVAPAARAAGVGTFVP